MKVLSDDVLRAVFECILVHDGSNLVSVILSELEGAFPQTWKSTSMFLSLFPLDCCWRPHISQSSIPQRTFASRHRLPSRAGGGQSRPRASPNKNAKVVHNILYPEPGIHSCEHRSCEEDQVFAEYSRTRSRSPGPRMRAQFTHALAAPHAFYLGCFSEPVQLWQSNPTRRHPAAGQSARRMADCSVASLGASSATRAALAWRLLRWRPSRRSLPRWVSLHRAARAKHRPSASALQQRARIGDVSRPPLARAHPRDRAA
jgi:hypothetical protein